MRLSRWSAASWASFAAASLAALAVFTSTRAASAAEVDVAGKPLEIDVTNTGIGNYHFNNRNDVRNTPGTKVDDDYAEFLDRFNLQLSWWRLTLGVRFDGYVAQRPTDADIARLVAQDATKPVDRIDLTQRYAEELNTRFLPTIYPTKLYLAYQQPSLEVTLGDFYVQLGRGIVFSVRKIDELSIDTTVRGAKAAFDRSFGGFHLGLLGFAGEMNPLRVDETSARRLNVAGNDPLFFGFPTARELTYTTLNQFGTAIAVDETARPNYLEDAVFGGKIEAGTKLFTLAMNGAILQRKDDFKQNQACVNAGRDRTGTANTLVEGLCQIDAPNFELQNDPSRDHDQIRNVSGSLQVPSIADHGDLYVEIAGQQLADGRIDSSGKPLASSSGFAAYVAASARGGPITLSLEGKHYRGYFPLPANVDLTKPGFGASEFNNVFYSQLPTAQSIYIEPAGGASPNLCVTGGRALLTYRFNPKVAVYTWLGRFADWTEIDPHNYDCASSAKAGPGDGGHGLSKETDTWDYATGAEIFLEGGKSKVNMYMGAIDITEVDPHNAAQNVVTDTFYREGYLRYDLVKHISGPFSVQAQGWHRRRYEPTTAKPSWWEGENYTALQWSPHLSGIFGFEYLIKDGCEPGAPLGEGKYGAPKNVCYFWNGGAQWRSAGAGGVAGQVFDTVNLFIGERRGALRCVSGVCRVFPPFSGAKIELVSRF